MQSTNLLIFLHEIMILEMLLGWKALRRAEPNQTHPPSFIPKFPPKITIQSPVSTLTKLQHHIPLLFLGSISFHLIRSKQHSFYENKPSSNPKSFLFHFIFHLHLSIHKYSYSHTQLFFLLLPLFLSSSQQPLKTNLSIYVATDKTIKMKNRR